ncbi:MAG: ferrochelatase [Anaerolineae bacterium]
MTDDAILLLAYGGPDSPADLPDYLANVRGGRPAPPHLLAEIAQRYALIGGRSPLREITERAAASLATAVGVPVYVGMRHWHPFIHETIGRIAADGVRRAVAICMAPHYSRLSVGAYRSALDRALAEQGADIAIDFVESWHTAGAYLDGMAAHVRRALLRFPAPVRPAVKIAFTAHSLPAAILEHGDPYVAQLDETALAIVRRLGWPADRWALAFQSAPRTGEPMLGPQIEELLAQWAETGERHVLIAPIGFVAEHAEVLYDLDIALQKTARARGVHLERAALLNDSPPLVAALAEVYRRVSGNRRLQPDRPMMKDPGYPGGE